MTSHAVSKFLSGAWLCVLAISGLFAGCHDSAVSGGDSETHFLEKCTDSCSAGLTCLCGVCSKSCTAEANCGDLSPAASCEDSCTESSSKMCDVACAKDADCGSFGADFGCSAGHCRQTNAGGSGGAASGAGGTGASGAGPLGACHAEPDLTPTLPAPSALDPDLVARAAVVLGACMPDDGVPRSAAHIWLAHLGSPQIVTRFGEQLECLANASCGCAAIEHCLGFVYRLPPADCPSICQGEVFSGCGDGAQVSIDCTRFGLSCDPAGICAEPPSVVCDGTEAATCTAQGEVLACERSVLRKAPCQANGFSCVGGACAGSGSACVGSAPSDEGSQPLGTGCSGDTLQACLGGQTTSIDCATQGPGFSCQARDGSFFCGLAAECVPADNYSTPVPQTCDGTTVSFCNAGRLEHLECTALGFSGCEVDTKVGHYGCTPGVTLQ